MLEARSLYFAYPDGPAVLDGVDLNLANGEIVALLGASGCGKSTLLRVLSGLEPLQAGKVDWHEKPDFSFVFQEAALMPWATVANNVALPLTIAHTVNRAQIAEALTEVGLEGFEERYPATLSGGQKMRVSIARALAAKPALMFLDEPFGALDEILRFQMNALLLNVRAQHDLTCLFVTHSIYEAAYLADRVLVMHGGRITDEYKPQLDRSMSASDQRASVAFFGAVKNIGDLLGRGEA